MLQQPGGRINFEQHIERRIADLHAARAARIGHEKGKRHHAHERDHRQRRLENRLMPQIHRRRGDQCADDIGNDQGNDGTQKKSDEDIDERRNVKSAVNEIYDRARDHDDRAKHEVYEVRSDQPRSDDIGFFHGHRHEHIVVLHGEQHMRPADEGKDERDRRSKRKGKGGDHVVHTVFREHDRVKADKRDHQDHDESVQSDEQTRLAFFLSVLGIAHAVDARHAQQVHFGQGKKITCHCFPEPP